MANEKKTSGKKFVPLKETCTYRLTIECDMKDYQSMVDAVEGYSTIIKEEIEAEV